MYVNTTPGDLGTVPVMGNGTGFLGLITQHQLIPGFNSPLNPDLPFFILESSPSTLDNYIITEKENLIAEMNHNSQLNIRGRKGGGGGGQNNPKEILGMFNITTVTPTAGLIFYDVDYATLTTNVEVMWESQAQFLTSNPGRSVVGASMNMIASAFGTHPNLKTFFR